MTNRCPACGLEFGLKGPKLRRPTPGQRTDAPSYECPGCGTALIGPTASGTERWASTIGFGSLLISSSLRLYELTKGIEGPARDWMIALDVAGILGLSLWMLLRLREQRFKSAQDAAKH